MKRFVSFALFALPFALAMHAQTPSPSQAAQDSGPVVSADNAFTAAMVKGDKSAATKFLDENFEFTNTEGKTFTRAAMIEQFPAVVTATPGATNVHSYNYGKMGVVLGVDNQTRFERVWVSRSGGWRIFNFIETAIGPSKPLAPGGGDCDNPCRTIPCTPKTEIDKAIFNAWQHAKMDEWHPNSSDWALRTSDEFSFINNGTDRSKAERVAILAKQQAAGELGPPGDPIHDIRMYDIGKSAAIMRSIHDPYRGGKPYYNIRVWILRDGLWQLAASQQTTIQSAASVPAVK